MKKPNGPPYGSAPLAVGRRAASAKAAPDETRCRKSSSPAPASSSRAPTPNNPSPSSIAPRSTSTGLASIGDLLQQVTAGGKALNAKFNSSGNFGYPADGGGIGAGSAQVDLRNLGTKRVLVLVDGIRWVNESSASGVSGAADLNTIPMSIIDRIEVLEDGASAIYGSDAIAGVVNIITRKDFEGVELNAYCGEYEIGGATTDASITLGGGGERFTACSSPATTSRKASVRASGNSPLSPSQCGSRGRQLGYPAGPIPLLRSGAARRAPTVLCTAPVMLL